MPTLSATVVNGTIITEVGVSLLVPDPVQPFRVYNALVATGASDSVVSPRVVSELKSLPIAQGQYLSDTGTPHLSAIHALSLSIFPENLPSGQKAHTNWEPYRLMELPYQPRNFDILLGMDILKAFHITIQGHEFLATV